VVVAQHVAVIGREDYERVVRQAAPVEDSEDPADLLVEEGDTPVVALARRAGLLLPQIPSSK